MKLRILVFTVLLVICPSYVHAAIVAVAHASAFSTDSGNTAVTAGIDCSTANFAVAVVGWDGVHTNHVRNSSFNSGNSDWPNGLTQYISSDGVQIWHRNDTFSSTETFTIAYGSPGMGAIAVGCFSGVAASPLDQETGHIETGSTTTTSPGTLTPANPGALVVTGFGGDATVLTTLTVSSPFTTQVLHQTWEDWHSGNSFPVGIAWEIQTTATARTPTWTLGTAGIPTSAMAVFNAASGAPPTPCTLTLLGVGKC